MLRSKSFLPKVDVSEINGVRNPTHAPLPLATIT